jgi:DNA-binding NarL/FixJ family response regulator
MKRSSIRHGVAEDFAPSRQSISNVLPNTPKLQIICDVSHAAEAAQRAKEQNPDWILSNIGLPTFQSCSGGKESQFTE